MTIVSLIQKCYSAIGMNFTQPLGTQHASKIYTNSVFKFLFSSDYINLMTTVSPK